MESEVIDMYGVVMDNRPESETSLPTFYIVPFQVVELKKDPTARPPGICYVTVVFKSLIPVPQLNISPDQNLSWGGNAPLDASLSDMLPFQTAPYHGFGEEIASAGGGQTYHLVGHGKFFATFAEAKADAALIYPGSAINLVPAQ